LRIYRRFKLASSIAWGITGAGAFLRESIDAVKKLLLRGYRVTAFVSRAGESVLKIYGFKNELEEALKGPYPTGIIYESNEPPSYPSTGRLYTGVYRAVVVSPASMNTIGKIVHGIADSLVSNLAMHAVKARIPVYILPVDAYVVKSAIPVLINRELCSKCGECSASLVCPTRALKQHPYYRVEIDLVKCNRCYKCLEACPHGAIKFDVEIVVNPVPYYLEVIKRLEYIPGVKLLHSPMEVVEVID
jgi:dihydromethanopterin reductase (acceptor)